MGNIDWRLISGMTGRELAEALSERIGAVLLRSTKPIHPLGDFAKAPAIHLVVTQDVRCSESGRMAGEPLCRPNSRMARKWGLHHEADLLAEDRHFCEHCISFARGLLVSLTAREQQA